MEYFFPGLHQPSDAKRFGRSFISVNRLRGRKGRKSDFMVGDWIMDSGAFTEISTHGKYRHSVYDYAKLICRWRRNGKLLAAVCQDWMCEPWILAKTGRTVRDHQRLTIERYDALLRCETRVYIMPVLQGYEPEDYVRHLRMYGNRLAQGAWVGVGSVCKRNASPKKILEVLMAIKMVRPDLRLHGFGLKITALRNGLVRALLYSADSTAWSFAARKEGRNPNDWREAENFQAKIAISPEYQGHFVELGNRSQKAPVVDTQAGQAGPRHAPGALQAMGVMTLANSYGEAPAPHQEEGQEANPKAMQGDRLSFPVVADRVHNQPDNTDDH